MKNSSHQLVARTVNHVERVEFRCSTCQQGFYRYAAGENHIQEHNQMPHRCSHCRDLVYFTAPYPHLRYKGKDFVSYDAITNINISAPQSLRKESQD